MEAEGRRFAASDLVQETSGTDVEKKRERGKNIRRRCAHSLGKQMYFRKHSDCNWSGDDVCMSVHLPLN